MKTPISHLVICSVLAGTTLLLGCKSDSEKELDKLVEEKIVSSSDELPKALGKAIDAKDIQLIKRLLFAGANPNANDKQGNTLLQNACKTEDPAIIDAIIAHTPDINRANKQKQTALYTAISLRQTDLAEKLINAGAQHNIVDAKGYSPLAWACSLGYGDVVNKLLNLGADPNQKVPTGREPLCVALEKQHVDIFVSLLRQKANINVATTEKKTLVSQIIETNAMPFMRALMGMQDVLTGAAIENAIKSLSVAISLGHEDMVKTLLEAGIAPADSQEELIKQAVMSTHSGVAAVVLNTCQDLDTQNPWVKAAITLAERHKLIQEGILSAKHTINPKTQLPRWGRLMQHALIKAIKKNNTTLAKRLLSAGASPYSTGADGSAITYAIAQDNEQILQLLYMAGAPLDEKDKPHALGEAAKLNACKCIEYMLSLGISADACAPQDQNQTPLRRALENKCIDAASILIENGADINNVYNGVPPISFLAINIQSVELLELMIRKGLHPDTYAYETGETLLMHAAAIATPNILDVLISSGANPHETNSIGSTPAMYAAAANRLENLKFLKSKGCNLRHRNHLGFDVARFAYDNISQENDSSAAQQTFSYMQKLGAARYGRYPYGRYARSKKATLDSKDPVRAKRNHARMQSNRQGAATP